MLGGNLIYLLAKGMLKFKNIKLNVNGIVEYKMIQHIEKFTIPTDDLYIGAFELNSAPF